MTYNAKLCKGDFCDYDFSSSAHSKDKKPIISSDLRNIQELEGSALFGDQYSKNIKCQSASNLERSLVDQECEEAFGQLSSSDDCESSSLQHIGANEIMYDIPYNIIMFARSGLDLSKKLVRDYIQGNEYSAKCLSNLEALSHSNDNLPVHFYRSVTVCPTCYKVYEILQKVRRKAKVKANINF